jgi:DNA-directed RNA polymerase subunit RPC12/RpoP
MPHVDANGKVTVTERVVRNGVSPMNPRVKYSQLACGHDVYGPRKLRLDSLQRCDECSSKENAKAAMTPSVSADRKET